MARITEQDMTELMAQTYSADAQDRADAVRELCPCQLKRNVPEVWQRVIALREDPERRVRAQVLHVLADGSPREYEGDIVAAMQHLAQDDDDKIRRAARKVLAKYRKSGNINVL